MLKNRSLRAVRVWGGEGEEEVRMRGGALCLTSGREGGGVEEGGRSERDRVPGLILSQWETEAPAERR